MSKEGDITIIDVFPGRNEMIKVSANSPNMIRTPFESPKIINLKEEGDNSFIYQTQGRNIYFNTVKSVCIYISNGKGDVVFPVTLIPQTGGPSTIYLRYGDEKTEQADKWEQSDDYTGTIIKLTRAMIMDMPPNGYAVKESTVKYEPMQQVYMTVQKEFVGSKLTGQIVELTNMTPFAIELKHNKFFFNGLRSISFGKEMISPQETIHAYIVLTRGRGD